MITSNFHADIIDCLIEFYDDIGTLNVSVCSKEFALLQDSIQKVLKRWESVFLSENRRAWFNYLCFCNSKHLGPAMILSAYKPKINLSQFLYFRDSKNTDFTPEIDNLLSVSENDIDQIRTELAIYYQRTNL